MASGAAPIGGPSMGLASGFWRLEENKIFEVALARHFQDVDRFERIASYLPNKSAVDVQRRFRQLEEDLRRIEDGASPSWQMPSPTSSEDSQPSKKPKVDVPINGDRRKGVPWTEEEHRLFLLGLAKFGKGDWRSIARNFVVSRTPTQVASHAQKYFIRLNSLNKKDKRRASIHDITSPAAPTPTCSDSTAPSTQPASPAGSPPGSLFPLTMAGLPLPAPLPGQVPAAGAAAAAFMVQV